jgi:DUF2934 family protein
MKQQAKPRGLRTGKTHNGLEKAHSSSDHIYVRVAVLAYSMYEQRGRQDGHDVEDWCQAEKTILEEMALQDTRSNARSDV